MMIRLYDPTAEPRAIAAQLAPRLSSLQGKRIGILDNGKANAGTLMLAVARRLQESYGAGEIVKRDKPVAGPALAGSAGGAGAVRPHPGRER
jgi:hypothetical protein